MWVIAVAIGHTCTQQVPCLSCPYFQDNSTWQQNILIEKRAVQTDYIPEKYSYSSFNSLRSL